MCKACYVCEGLAPPTNWFNNSRCSVHDVCLTCGINRSELSEIPWGRCEGFVCKECDENRIKNEIEAFQATEPEEMDLYDFDDIICPWCGNKHCPDGEDSCFYAEDEHDFSCGNCGRDFKVETTISYTYQSSKGEN